jgi:AcrR family transcriptional regulator
VAARSDSVDSRRTDTRERALAVALDLFARQGYTVTSLREIAEQLGVTKAALYFHFRTKEELLTAILRGYLDGIAALVTEAEEKRPLTADDQEQLLRRYAVHQSKWGLDLVVLVRNNYAEILDLPIGAEVKAVRRLLVDALAPVGATAEDRLRVQTALAAFQVAAMTEAMDGESDGQPLSDAALALALEILSGQQKPKPGETELKPSPAE